MAGNAAKKAAGRTVCGRRTRVAIPLDKENTVIIADEFVLINYPKTGTTFVRSALRSMYSGQGSLIEQCLRRLRLRRLPMRELMFPKLYGDYPLSVRDQHGVYRQIPVSDRKKTVVSIIRNPLTKYISSFVFGWWKDHPPLPLADVLESYPNYPDISFAEFYQLLNHPRVDEDKLSHPEARRLGSYTRMFLVFYSLDPDEAASRLLQGQSLNEILPPVVFLHQEHLRDELQTFLAGIGCTPADLAHIREARSRNVGSSRQKSHIPAQELAEVAAAILRDDKAILEAFPEYREPVTAVAEGQAASAMPTGRSSGPRRLGR